MAKILLVDDEPNILKLSAFIVKSLGYEVFTAENGRVALDLLNIQKIVPDLIISDLIMPEVGGFELCQKTTYPIIIVSAMSDEFKPDTAFKTRALDFIAKPFDLTYLRQRLAMTLYKLGKNPTYQPPVAVRLGNLELFKGENVLVLGQDSSALEKNELPRLYYNNTENFNLENLIKDSEIIGQTIQKKAGGLRVVEKIELATKLELIKKLNSTNLALGDITGIFFLPAGSKPSAELAGLFERVIA